MYALIQPFLSEDPHKYYGKAFSEVKLNIRLYSGA